MRIYYRRVCDDDDAEVEIHNFTYITEVNSTHTFILKKISNGVHNI